MTKPIVARTAAKRAWVRPELSRLSTAQAALSPLSAVSDGAYTKGS